MVSGDKYIFHGRSAACTARNWERVLAIAEKDIKLLWGRAAGRCSNPDCREKVSEINEAGESYLVGEMAHIIARQASGPRGQTGGGSNAYDNLVLLCPTCHTKIDKSPEGSFPTELLLGWKEQHENWVDSWCTTSRMASTQELMEFIDALLVENNHYFRNYGPQSQVAVNDPASSAYTIWVARRLDTILPNNRKIVQTLDLNRNLIPIEMAPVVMLFKDHATSYEQNLYERIAGYQQFPTSFAEAVRKWKK